MSEFQNVLTLIGFIALVILFVWDFLIFPLFISAQIEQVSTLVGEIRIALAELADEIAEMLDEEDDS